MFYGSILKDSIEEEKKGLIYACSLHDKILLRNLLRDINKHCGCHLRYMSELDMLYIEGSGEIILKYINDFESELFKACLISQLVADKIYDCDMVIMTLYKHFRNSTDYAIRVNKSPRVDLQLVGSYDNAFWKLKPKKFKTDFIEIFDCPLDVLYLGLTLRTVCSWKMPKMEEVIKKYIDFDKLTKQDFGIKEDFEDTDGFLEFIKKQVGLNSLTCLQYYPTIENKKILEQYLDDSDSDVRMGVQKALKKLNDRLGKNKNERG